MFLLIGKFMYKLISKIDGLHLAEHSFPSIGDNDVLVQTIASCYSKGTESSTVSNHQKSVFKKIVDNQAKIISLFKKKDFSGLYKKFKSQQESSINLGYSASGKVLSKGRNVKNIQVGDIVVVIGSSANHSQFSIVPSGLCININKNVDPVQASSAAIASIALNSIQLANPFLGSKILIVGCGLIGQFLIQFLKISGTEVTCVDIDKWRFDQSQKHGATSCLTLEEFENAEITDYFDNVYIATPTLDSKTWSDIGNSSKHNAEIIMLGAADLNCPRDVFYKKHLKFLSPHSYGPGRGLYDYEILQKDFPKISKTWDLRSNIVLFCELLDKKKVSTEFLDIFKVADCSDQSLKEALDNNKSFSTILDWTNFEDSYTGNQTVVNEKFDIDQSCQNIAVCGYSEFAKEAHIPNLINSRLNFLGVHNRSSLETDKYNLISKNELLSKKIGSVVISSNHGSHASYLIEMMKHKKFSIIDKPLCTSSDELERIIKEKNSTDSSFICFMSRRYSKHINILREHISNYPLPYHADFLFHVPIKESYDSIYKEGGRLIGEMCHHVDLAIYLFGKPISVFYADNEPNKDFSSRENSTILLTYPDGSTSNIRYTTIGANEGAKESIKVSFGKNNIEIINFEETNLISKNKKKNLHSKYDKGFDNMWKLISELIIENDKKKVSEMNEIDLLVSKILLREEI